MTNKILTSIPFAGFYETCFSELAEYELNDCLENSNNLTKKEKEELCELVYDVQDFSSVRLDIAQEYAMAFNELFKNETGFELGLEFESMQSPREYNFETDRIFCFISPDKVKKLYQETDKKILNDIIKERFTSRSGFISNYENSLEEWIVKKTPKFWDHNQIETLIIARLKQAGNDDNRSFKDESLSYRLFERLNDERGNGKFNCLGLQYTSVKANPESVKRMEELLDKERS